MADGRRPLKPRHFVEYGLLRAIAFAAGLLPRRAQVALGRGIGSLAHRLIRRRRETALSNLARCLPDKSPAERAAIARGAFRNFGQLLVDGMLHGKLIRRPERWLRVEGLEHIRAAYEKGRGVFLFSAHYGNWELVALNQSRLGLRLAMVVRALDNPLLDRWLNRLRESHGNRVAYKKDAAKAMLGALRQKIGVAILIDQAYTGEGRLDVPFFGISAPTVPTLGLLARRTGAAMVPVFSWPEPGGVWAIRYGAPLELSQTEDRDADAAAITVAATRIIEDAIRERPDCWLWMHERFKA
jgi:KDO2-lipid IV(A) lauroyltransferase